MKIKATLPFVVFLVLSLNFLQAQSLQDTDVDKYQDNNFSIFENLINHLTDLPENFTAQSLADFKPYLPENTDISLLESQIASNITYTKKYYSFYSEQAFLDNVGRLPAGAGLEESIQSLPKCFAVWYVDTASLGAEMMACCVTSDSDKTMTPCLTSAAIVASENKTKFDACVSDSY